VNTTSNFTIEGRPILSLHKFCELAGISDVTAWRWRKSGWLTTVNIAGRPYLTDKAVSEFLHRAEAGEFTKEHRSIPVWASKAFPERSGSAHQQHDSIRRHA